MREHIVTRKQREGPRDWAHSSAPHEEDTVDHLEKAKHSTIEAQANQDVENAQLDALIAIAHALVALVENEAILKRLDALTEFDGGKSLFVTLTK